VLCVTLATVIVLLKCLIQWLEPPMGQGCQQCVKKLFWKGFVFHARLHECASYSHERAIPQLHPDNYS
jgi:hypothetical protein